MVEGLEKVVAMLEERFGRIATTGLLLLIGLAIAAYSIHVIVTQMVLPLYEFVSSHLSGGLEITIATVFYVTAFIAAAVILLPLLWIALTKRRISQAVIDTLAELRSRAIHEIYNAAIKTEAEFSEWKIRNDAWREEVISVLAKHFPKSEVLGFQRLGAIPLSMFPVFFNNQHMHELNMFVKRLSILEDIIKRYSQT